eukprot:7583-Heterococcus_DN1.PRE.3
MPSVGTCLTKDSAMASATGMMASLLAAEQSTLAIKLSSTTQCAHTHSATVQSVHEQHKQADLCVSHKGCLHSVACRDCCSTSTGSCSTVGTAESNSSTS